MLHIIWVASRGCVDTDADTKVDVKDDADRADVNDAANGVVDT